MTHALAIDPDTKACGCALVEEGGRLVRTWTQGASVDVLYGLGDLSAVVVERPVYQGERTNAARPADLMALAWAGALLAGAYAGAYGARVVALPPSDARDPSCTAHTRNARAANVRCTCARGWKGSEPKPVMHARAWTLLDAGERLEFPPYTGERINAAVQKGAADRWAKPGGEYYPRAFDSDTLDAMCLAFVYTGRMSRR